MSAASPGDLFDDAPDAAAMIVVERGRFAGKILRLAGAEATIGRSSKCDLSLKGAGGVSRTHCKIVYDDERYLVDDMGSRNGTAVNNVEVRGRAVLADGDLIEIGDEALRFVLAESDGTDALSQRETFVLDPAGRPPVDRSARNSGAAVMDSEKLVRAPRLQMGSEELEFNHPAAGADDAPDYIPAPDTEVDARDSSHSSDLTPSQGAITKVPEKPLPQSDLAPLGMLPDTALDGPNLLVSRDKSAALSTEEGAPLPVLDLQNQAPVRRRTLTDLRRPAPGSQEGQSSVVRSLLAGLLLGLVVALGLIAVWDHFLNEGDLRRDLMFAFARFTGDDNDALNEGALDDALVRPAATSASTTAPASPTAGTPTAGTPTAGTPAAGSPTAGSPANAAPAVAKDNDADQPDGAASAQDAAAVQAASTPPGVPGRDDEESVDVADASAGRDVTLPFGGHVTAVLIQSGDRVRAGQRLLKVDATSSGTKRKLTSLRNEERALAAAAAKGRRQAKIDLKKVRAELRSLARKARTFSLKAPIDGTVGEVHLTKGQRVSKGKRALTLLP